MRTTLTVLFGPIVWALHLLLAYGGHASFCAIAGRSDRTDTQPLIAMFTVGTVIALLLLVLPLSLPRRWARSLFDVAAEPNGYFLMSLTRWLAGLSLVGVAANGLAMLIVSPC